MASILHVSDTHQNIRLLDDILSAARFLSEMFKGGQMPDMVAVTGDVMNSGFDAHELESFIRFLDGWADLGVPVVFVPGNHDRPFHASHFESKARMKGLGKADMNYLLSLADQVRQRCHVLVNNSTIVNGVKIHGFAWQPPFMDWAFNLEDGMRKMETYFIHPEADVLLLHAPPLGILDQSAHGESVGDPLTLDMLESGNGLVPLRAHTVLFGHVHECGERNAFRKVGGKWRLFRNGALFDGRHEPRPHFAALREMVSADPLKFLPGFEVWRSLIVFTDGPQADMERWVRELIEDVIQYEEYADGAWVLEENYDDPIDHLAVFAKEVSFDHRLHRYDSGAISWRANMIKVLAEAGRAEIEKEVGRLVVAKPVDVQTDMWAPE